MQICVAHRCYSFLERDPVKASENMSFSNIPDKNGVKLNKCMEITAAVWLMLMEVPDSPKWEVMSPRNIFIAIHF